MSSTAGPMVSTEKHEFNSRCRSRDSNDVESKPNSDPRVAMGDQFAPPVFEHNDRESFPMCCITGVAHSDCIGR